MVGKTRFGVATDCYGRDCAKPARRFDLWLGYRQSVGAVASTEARAKYLASIGVHLQNARFRRAFHPIDCLKDTTIADRLLPRNRRNHASHLLGKSAKDG
jgi:hypothetical protein